MSRRALAAGYRNHRKLSDRLQLQSLIMQEDVRTRFEGDLPYQRLLGRWIENKGNDSEGTERSAFFRITQYYELEEGAQLARQTFREQHTPIVLGRAALVLGQLGNVDDILLLEQSIENNNPIGRLKQRDELGVVGDIALAMCVVLSGQEPQDYGCKWAPAGRPAFEKGSYFQYRFDKGDEDQRQAARTKWRNWRAANKLDPREPAAGDFEKGPSGHG